MDFIPFPKMPRLNKPMIVTEKIDGSNACIVIERAPEVGLGTLTGINAINEVYPVGGMAWRVGAQSRKRMILPEDVKKGADNAGFASWVRGHAEDLVAALGPGRHFGEWWGPGIQRGYGVPTKRFSLFNVDRYADVALTFDDGTVLTTVPVLHQGNFDSQYVNILAARLLDEGSKAAPGWDRPEGVVAYHTASGQSFKAFCDPTDEAEPKGAR